MKSFQELGLREDILQSIKKIGFYEPTPIQEASIPIILEGHDLIAGSSTGSGKTFAFGAGIIQRITKGKGVQALIQVPTRELAEQLLQTFTQFSKKTRLSVAAVYGGVSIGPQINALKRADIVIGTPGRTLDHLERGTLRLKAVKHVVLDEADRMLDMGFLPDIKSILSQCPDYRQTLLFSATMPAEIVRLAKQFMNDPQKINLAEQVDPTKLSQETYFVPSGKKILLLLKLMKQEDEKELIIVFTNTRRDADRVAKALKTAGLKALPIHGGLSQNQRLKVIKQFNGKANVNVIVCTDVAARGLDIPGVSHVYNFDIPNESKQYLHRIGRTARAGANGQAVNLVCKRDQLNYKDVLRDNKLEIPTVDLPHIEKPKGFDEERNSERKPSRFPKWGQRRAPTSPRRGRQSRSSEEGRDRRSSVQKKTGFTKKRSYGASRHSSDSSEDRPKRSYAKKRSFSDSEKSSRDGGSRSGFSKKRSYGSSPRSASEGSKRSYAKKRSFDSSSDSSDNRKTSFSQKKRFVSDRRKRTGKPLGKPAFARKRSR